MQVKDVMKCSFQNWYQEFRNITVESVILPVSDEFKAYLLKDGIILPRGGPFYTADTNSDESEGENWSGEDQDEPEAPNFPEFDNQLKDAIEHLGGRVFPKLNWSSPRDAAWIALNNTCCCSEVSDIYLLLKSSDFIAHDLTKMLFCCDDYNNTENNVTQSTLPIFLVLRKWVDIDPSGEYRCFVKDNSLIGICQREHSLYFDHIGCQKNDIVCDILFFFKESIQFKFDCPDYVFDVYREKKDSILLIDFNPFNPVTDALLFDWTELSDGSLLNSDHSLPLFRYILHNRGVQPRSVSYHAIPRDIVDISTGQDSFKFVDLMTLNLTNDESDNESEDKNDKINGKA